MKYDYEDGPTLTLGPEAYPALDSQGRFRRQRAFDAAVRGLYAQGVPAAKEGSCRYRVGTLKCAVGQLIPDEAYSDELEGIGLADARVARAVGIGGDPDEEVRFLRSLQDALHDNYVGGSLVQTPFRDWLLIAAESFASCYRLSREVLYDVVRLNDVVTRWPANK